MNIYRQQIQQALNNSSLQEALDRNAERRIQARQVAYASLPDDLGYLRQQAHNIRAQTITDLDKYLAQFSARATANGMIVHQAADARHAVEIILEITRQHNARLVAKSKTMIGEEIELNHALEAAGLQVVETDLGEYIVQLRGERPAHIITPAVHLSRADVGHLFEEKLSLPYTEDVPLMTAAARQALRQVFLRADIGISGVNFGVAESGTLCLLTNEGNGRMVTTLPPVHIALMGIERLVPTLDDLGTMLLLLPRSATGQKLTVYTSLIHGPCRSDECSGPVERHLILVDNGRRSLLGSPFEEALYCIRCGACLNACPVFREIGGHAYVGAHGEVTAYPGPIGSILSPALFGIPEFGQLARTSSLCGACKDACPVDIDLPKLLLRVRAADYLTAKSNLPINLTERSSAGVEMRNLNPAVKPTALSGSEALLPTSLKLGLRIYAWFAKSSWRFKAAQRLLGWLGYLAAPRSGWLRLPAFSGWGYSRDFPRPASQTFHQKFRHLEMPQPLPTKLPSAKRVDQPVSDKPSPVEPPSVLDVFCSELARLGASVQVSSSAQIQEKILQLLREMGVNTLQSWKSNLPLGLVEGLQREGMQVVYDPDPIIKVGLTGALCGVADTGSLLLTTSAGQAATASLLPEVHLAIVDASQIYPDLSSVMQKQSPVYQEILNSPSAFLISGPSRTADIEMTLTIGVHGPRELYVFCLV